MTDYAIHSPNDGELLIKFHDELVKNGIKTHEWNKAVSPSNEREFFKQLAKSHGRSVWFYTLAVYSHGRMYYNNHGSTEEYAHRNLTPENFNSVLNEVLQNFGINV